MQVKSSALINTLHQHQVLMHVPHNYLIKQGIQGIHNKKGKPGVGPLEALLAAAVAVSYLEYPALSSLTCGTCQLPSPFQLLLLPHAARLLQNIETTQVDFQPAAPLK